MPVNEYVAICTDWPTLVTVTLFVGDVEQSVLLKTVWFTVCGLTEPIYCARAGNAASASNARIGRNLRSLHTGNRLLVFRVEPSAEAPAARGTAHHQRKIIHHQLNAVALFDADRAHGRRIGR